MDKSFLGKSIREQRKRKGLRQCILAEMVGLSRIHLSEIERGKKTPSMEAFIRIVNALDVPADILLREIVNGGKPYMLNEITHKMNCYLTAEQVRTIADMIDAFISNMSNFDKKEEKIQ